MKNTPTFFASMTFIGAMLTGCQSVPHEAIKTKIEADYIGIR